MTEDIAWPILSAIAALIWGVSWTDVFLMVALGFVLYLFYRLHRKRQYQFSLDDLFVSEATGKADVSKVVIIIMAGLSVWVVVTLVNKDKDVDFLLSTILGIFVAGRTANIIWPGPKGPPGEPPKSS